MTEAHSPSNPHLPGFEGHIPSLERVMQAHSFVNREWFRVPNYPETGTGHAVYAQGQGEPCYLCVLLFEIERLTRELANLKQGYQNFVDDNGAEQDSLRQRLSEANKDAQRYRFLRQGEDVIPPEHEAPYGGMWSRIYLKGCDREKMDAVIDAAMAECSGDEMQAMSCDSAQNDRARPADETPAALPVPSGWQGKEPWFKVGDQVVPTTPFCGQRPVCTITEITERGFKYTHESISAGPRYGWCEGGETYEPTGYQSLDDYRSEVIRATQAASR